jgi:hypothetical protein
VIILKQVFDNTTKTGTAGGTLLTIFANISREDLVKTVLLAAIGAVVSFSVTLVLKFLIKYFKK